MTVNDFNAPIFVVGAPRSGTTLVYSILCSAPEVIRYEEGETRLLQCKSVYGPLSLDSNFSRFLNDWMVSQQFLRSGLEPKTFRKEAEHHRDGYLPFLRFFMKSMCVAQGKTRWVEKTPANVHHLKQLADAFPDALFVHVIRDGRDVALSRRKLGWRVVPVSDPVLQLTGAAVFWQQLVEIGHNNGEDLGNRYYELHYEDLVLNPKEECNRLEAFVGMDLSAASTGSTPIGALRSGYSSFDDSVSGISSVPAHRWRDQLTELEKEVLAQCIGSTLQKYGYSVETSSTDAQLLGYRIFALATARYLAFKRWVRFNTPLRQLLSPRLLDY